MGVEGFKEGVKSRGGGGPGRLVEKRSKPVRPGIGIGAHVTKRLMDFIPIKRSSKMIKT